MPRWSKSERCKDCQFFAPPENEPAEGTVVGDGDVNRAHCHRYPPKVIVTRGVHETKYPIIERNSLRCGEFVEDKQKGAP